MISEYLTIFGHNLLPGLETFGKNTGIAAAIIFAFWIAARITAYLITRFSSRMPHNAGLLQLLAQTTKIAVVIFGLATAMGTVGINVAALVAGLGLTGFALGFAFRDVLSNLLAGILLLLFRPFDIGDHISVTGLEGDVTSIDLRYTVIRQPETIVLMPNQNLFTNPIIVTAPRAPAPGTAPAAVTPLAKV